MVDTSLNKKYTADNRGAMDFSPLPDGIYRARVKEVTPWEAKTQNVKVIVKDENGKAVTDEKGEKVRELVPNCTFYNCTVKLEIVGGAYDGRIIFHNLTTHPNMDYTIPNFLYGIGLQEVAASEVQEKTKGLLCDIDVYTDNYEKTVQDKETGLDKVEVKYVNRVKSFKQIPAENPNAEIETQDFGF
jgi:hypothetical protein